MALPKKQEECVHVSKKLVRNNNNYGVGGFTKSPLNSGVVSRKNSLPVQKISYSQMKDKKRKMYLLLL